MSQSKENNLYTKFLEVMTMPDGRSAVPDDMLGWLKGNGFFTAPASTKYHGAHPGGLAEHSITVTEILLDFTEQNGLVWMEERSPYIVGMFHDLCKIDYYGYDAQHSACYHKEDCLLRGHGDKSVMLLSMFQQLTLEEILCIRYHMGAYTDPKYWDDYGRAVEACPNVLWTHHADMFASRVLGV